MTLAALPAVHPTSRLGTALHSPIPSCLPPRGQSHTVSQHLEDANNHLSIWAVVHQLAWLDLAITYLHQLLYQQGIAHLQHWPNKRFIL